MRRVFGVTFTGLGAFLVVLAILSRFYLPGQVIKFPLNEYSITTLTGTNVHYFNRQFGFEAKATKARAISTTQGDVSAGSSSTAVWNSVTGVFDISTSSDPGTAITYSSERLAFNRRTGALINCCGAEVGGKHVHLSGLGYVWPFGVQKKTYQLYDGTLLRTVPVTYKGTATVDGLTTYIFVEHVSNQKFGSISVPGSIVKLAEPTVTLGEYLTATNTYYVDPHVGSPVKVVENQDVSLEYPSTGATALTVLKGTFTDTPASIASAVHTARGYDTEILWVQDAGPLIGIILGVVLLALGLWFVLGERPEEYEYDVEDEEVPTEA